jgi:hypothetical protein
MNQASNNSSKAAEIRTRLFQENDTCKLEFIFPDGNKIDINTEEPDTEKNLKKVFNEIIKLLLKEDVEIKDLQKDGGSGMAKEVFGEYIESLNKEVQGIRDEIKNSLYTSKKR